MELHLALMTAMILLSLFSEICGEVDDNTAEGATTPPRKFFYRKSFRFPARQRMPLRGRQRMPLRERLRMPLRQQMPLNGMTDEEPQQYELNQMQTVDPNINSLMSSNKHLLHIIRRLESKVDRILDTADFEENAKANDIRDMMNKMNLIHQNIGGSAENAFATKCTSENEMPQNNLMRELVAAVQYSNENIRKLTSNFDQVMESGRRSMQSLNKVSDIVEDINERTIRMQNGSPNQYIDVRSNSKGDEIVGSGNPNVETKYDSNDDAFRNRNRNSPTNSIEITRENGYVGPNSRGPIVSRTGTTYESNDSYGVLNQNRNSPVSSTEVSKENGNIGNNNADPVTRTVTTYESDGSDKFNRQPSGNFQGNRNADYESRVNEIFDRNMNHPSTLSERENENVGANRQIVQTNSRSNFELNDKDMVNRNMNAIVPPTSFDYKSNDQILDYNRNVPSGIVTENRTGPVQNTVTTTTTSNNQFNKNGNENFDKISEYNRNALPKIATESRMLNENESNGPTQNSVVTTTTSKNQVNKNVNEKFDKIPEYNRNAPPAIVTENRILNENESTGPTQNTVVTTTTSNNQANKNGNNNGDEISEYNRNAPPGIVTESRMLNENRSTGPAQNTVVTTTTTTSNNEVDKSGNGNVSRDGISEYSKNATPGIVTENRISNENESTGPVKNTVVTKTTTTSNNQANNNGNDNRDGISEYNRNAPPGIVTENKILNENESTGPAQNTVVTTTTSNNQVNKNGNDNSDGISDKNRNASPGTITESRSLNENGSTGPNANTVVTTSTSNNQFNENGNDQQKFNQLNNLDSNGNASNTTKTTTSTTTNSKSKKSTPVLYEPDKQGCHELTSKTEGVYIFGSPEQKKNDLERSLNERYCEYNTDGNAWTVIQRRFASRQETDFNRTWSDYKIGFGDLGEEFWFGNDFISQLTSDDDMELRIIIQDESGRTDWLQYSLFKVNSDKQNYKLMIDGYSGSIEDRLLNHNNQEFSTVDRRNGTGKDKLCPAQIGNGWWFRNCADENALGNWLGRTATKMLIRPKTEKK